MSITQPRLFDAAASEAAARAGMEQATANHASLLTFARTLAVEIACSRPARTCTADDVARALEDRGVSCRALGNAAGGLFRESCWQWTGRFVLSERVHAHRNPLRVWRYIGGDRR
jgi:hypothetical protein